MFEVFDSGDGICTSCGFQGRSANGTGWVEPDATNYPCPDCGENSMMGYEEALLSGLWEPRESEY